VPVDVRIVERGPAFGPGLAYSTRHDCHTLNNFAGRLSAFDDDPDHLIRWCDRRGEPVSPTSFLTRSRYGEYLTSVLDDAPAPAGSVLRRTLGDVVDVTAADEGYEVVLSSGRVVSGDVVVLALGNPPPRPLPEWEQAGGRYLPDPWAADLLDRGGRARKVLLLGTGLTMLDVVALLAPAYPYLRFTAASRHGLLPRAHVRRDRSVQEEPGAWAGSLDEVLATFSGRVGAAEAGGGSWREVVDSLRAHANRLWRGLSEADRERFVHEVARHWDVLRHRMAPDMADLSARLRRDGVLEVRTTDGLDPAEYDLVVNCTGPQPVPTPGWSPLVDTLLATGSIRANRLGLGLDLDRDGRVVDASGRVAPGLFAVGAARRGVDWEVAAIPDLRRQAAELASVVLAGRSGSGERSTVSA
jgi:uncharacterized NAD(P)/FAD-binding protein YdhS